MASSSHSGRKRQADEAHDTGCGQGCSWSLASACARALRDLLAPAPRTLSLSSPCAGSVAREVCCQKDGSWCSFCPVCKRPIRGTFLSEEPPSKALRRDGKCAYVCALWGSAPGYVLGAMVLAKSLRSRGTKHDLVLVHTDGVAKPALELLAKAGWKPVEVEAVQGVDRLYNHGEPRFEGVFTKLQVFGLQDYAKVLCMDIDTLVIGSMDELFDLDAPAANARGPQDSYKHGDAIDGANFFLGHTRTKKSWGQCWGINAGVMLLEPNSQTLKQTLLEVTDNRHPSHIKGNGPEQDYLSRYFANCWTHVGVEYNFQLHQMYHVLHPREYCDPRLAFMKRFMQDPDSSGIHLVHYSGSVKPWSRYLDPEYVKCPQGAEVEQKFLRATLESFNGYWLWALRDRNTVEMQGEKEGVAFGPDGKLHWIDWENSWSGSSEHQLGPEVVIPEGRVESAERFVAMSIVWWCEVYEQLQQELGVLDLAQEVSRACAPPQPKEDLQKSPEVRGWRCRKGWWTDLPLENRASAFASCIPEPYVTLSFGGQAVLHMRGQEALEGCHLQACLPDGSALAPVDGDVLSWANLVPTGAFVLFSAVRQPPEEVAALLEQLLGSGGFEGLPSAGAPRGCSVLAFVGQKGNQESWQTMAAADAALASSVPCNGT